LVDFFVNKQTNKQAMPVEQYTYWSMTINNPDENDYVLVRNPNDRYIRQLVWTPEVGEEGTPHIQAWVRLQRNQTFTFMKKLFPRGHFKACTKDDYVENTNQYAQKNDKTTAGAHTITLNDPLVTIETIMKKVIERVIEQTLEQKVYTELDEHRLRVQREFVREDYRNAKFFVSATYKQMWREYGHDMYLNLYSVYEQTRDAEDNCVERREEGDASGSDGGSQGDEDGACETDEGSSESAGDQSDEEDASSECGE